jgi:hypothetical protein
MKTSIRKQVVRRDSELAEDRHVPFACPHCAFEFIFGVEDPNIEVDHKIPISAGGTDDLENLQVVCRSCNRSKRSYGAPVTNRKKVTRVVLCSCNARMFISDFSYHVSIDLVRTNALLCIGCGGEEHDEEPHDPDFDANFTKVTKKSFL